MQNTLLGGMSPEHFLAEYWHKKPLLIRQAVPDFEGVIDRGELFELACEPDVESRFIREHDGVWDVRHGPQSFAMLNQHKQPWTMLVQGLNLWLAEADALLHSFDFIPKARLDDLMVSFATDGGGIGAHVDSYDVFLLQGPGRRRWRISQQTSHEWVPDIPIKLLANFEADEEWILEPGDMLYLPPDVAHEGTALGPCFTYSIGFRAPSAQELGTEFLAWLQEHIALQGHYSDPDLAPQAHPAEISETMVDQVQAMLERIRWRREDVRAFLGHMLTEPKPQVFFEPPDTPAGEDDFAECVQAHGFVLDPGTLLLFDDQTIYLNGQPWSVSHTARAGLIELADRRRLMPAAQAFPRDLVSCLYQLYLDGFGYTLSV